MNPVRRIARSALMMVTLAYVLALGQLAHARMVGAHVALAQELGQLGQLGVICSEHGRSGPQLPGAPERSGHECPDCVACPAKTFASARIAEASPADWPLRPATVIAYWTAPDLANGSRAPPDLTARGPPVLI